MVKSFRIYPLAILLIFFVSCSNKVKTPLLSPENLESLYLTVDQNTDTIFRTPKGALLKIEKGSFSEKVELEIKEAYSMQDMLLGGLVTESDGMPLTSGGMIYINAKNGSAVPLLKPIKAALPTDYIDSAMQVYKSDTDSINWKPVDTLPDNNLSEQIAGGRYLFMSNCATCHGLEERLTGPALRGFRNRGKWSSREEIYKWIRNPSAYMAGDLYTRNLKNEYGSVMQAFPAFSKKGMDAIIAYLENAEFDPYDDIMWKLKDTASLYNIDLAKICSDTIYFQNPSDTIPFANIDTTVFSDSDSTIYNETDTSFFDGLRGGFTDKPSSRAYVFEIKTLGWYNIDAGVLGRKGTILSEIKVKVTPGEFTALNVYIFFPVFKDLSVGQPHDSNVFHFDKIDGKIPVFLGSQGVAIAFGSINDEIYVGSKTFVAATKQEIIVNVKKSSEEEFIQLIKQNKIEGIDLNIRKQNMKVENRPCSYLSRTDSTTMK